MANIRFGAMIADARGKLGGVTFTRSGAGSVARTTVKCTNPRSARQGDVRSRLSHLAKYWSATLEAADRAAWRDYALNTSWTNRVGTAANVSGMSAFIRLNSLRLQASLVILDTAPLQYGHAGTPAFAITAGATAQEIELLLPGDPWDDEETANHMLFFQRPNTSPGRDAIPAGGRFLQAVAGAVAPGLFPVTEDAPAFPLMDGLQCHVTGIFLDADGRVGAPYTASIITVDP